MLRNEHSQKQPATGAQEALVSKCPSCAAALEGSFSATTCTISHNFLVILNTHNSQQGTLGIVPLIGYFSFLSYFFISLLTHQHFLTSQ